MSAGGAPALTLRDVTVRHGTTVAVDRLSLDVDQGTVLAVLGPSGCGKSSLLRAIAGLEPLAAGSVSAAGHDLTGVPTHRRGFALMFQDGQLFDHQSVARNVGYALRMRRAPREAARTRVAELLDLVGLADLADRMPATLSGGERQRVALARALAGRPRVLLLDEPLSALDRGLREELAGQLRTILRAAGTTALMVTHDQEEAFAVADRMAVMRAGRLVQEGASEQVWEHPADAWTARFLGYPVVLEGAAAHRIAELAGPLAGQLGTQPVGAVALRRSALRVAEEGPLAGTVSAVRQTPDLTRVEVEVDGLGPLPGVAPPGAVVGVGERVRLAVEPSRLATLPGGSPDAAYTESS
ncbi:MAG: ABC transporter ATP-binding protein [Marmoricola sp.]